MLPHGPHSARDVLATHILKEMGSYEHTGYAIQDTAETVGKHYGRFLPKGKSAVAAQIINKVCLETPSGHSTSPPDMKRMERECERAF